MTSQQTQKQGNAYRTGRLSTWIEGETIRIGFGSPRKSCYNRIHKRGARGLGLAERSDQIARPKNLIWIMPA